MHTIMFSKKEINLHCCSTDNELISYLMQIYSEISWRNKQDLKVIILLDHILDGILGIDV